MYTVIHIYYILNLHTMNMNGIGDSFSEEVELVIRDLVYCV